jgi:hypothetical protein
LDPSSFWPKEWLPRDEDFRDVRIHTFGYDENLTKKTTLSVHDYAKDLLGCLKDSRTIPRNEKVSHHFVNLLNSESLRREVAYCDVFHLSVDSDISTVSNHHCLP